MKHDRFYYSRLPIVLFYTICIVFLLTLLTNQDNGIGMLESVDPITISGTVSIDGGPVQEIEKTLWNNGIRRALTVTGRFNRDITKDESLIIWPRNLRVKIYVNDKLKIASGQREQFPQFIRYAGNSFKIFYIGKVYKTDTIRIEIQKAYETCRINVINSFFDNLYVGRAGDLYQSIMRNEIINPIVGLVLILFGIQVLIFYFVQNSMKFDYMHQIYYLGWFCIAGGITYICDSCYEFIDLLFPYPVFNTLVDLSCIPFLLYFYLMFIVNALKHKKIKRFMRWVTSIFVVLELIPLFLQFNGIIDLHVLQDQYIFIGGIIVLIGCGSILYELLYYKNKNMKKVLLTAFPLMLSLTLKMLNGMSEHTVERTYLRVGILSSCLLLFHNTFKYVKHSIRLMEEEQQIRAELQNTRVAIMLSQIQPHFLYNTLNTLQYICKKDGVLAAEAIEHFSKYLRGNLDALTSNRLIPFEKELEHVNNYIYIQKLRFGKRVCVEYDLTYTDFSLPTLTLQPIVENAIRHGITKQADGGIVRIESRLVKDEIWIIVSDNGAGICSNNNPSDQRTHIGIKNVKKRLQLQCNGTLEFISTPGEGTKVIIRLKG
ncbi:two-component sensor kinase yesM, associated with MetSO reductase [Lachnospiraceae bacterium KM106-2]|nr:two-component sensor kinase yesM, associated with MetSO reductase [Lachnospiraceae bacterium KM106-2]